MEQVRKKYAALLEELRALDSVAVAYSGGVDSTLLLWAAREALGERAVAVTARVRSMPARECREAAEFCAGRGIEQIELEVDELAVEGFRQNPPNRCYLCKRAVFARIWELARERDLKSVVEGSNLDDEGDYRPGMAAIRELGVRSPLRAAELNKAEIRELSRALGLPTWDKPSYACLSSRFAYGETISEEGLRRVERAEEKLHALGFRQRRVRVHGDVARIELPPEDFAKLMADGTREDVAASLRSLGFRYVTLDLDGFRSGSMNEALRGTPGSRERDRALGDEKAFS